MKLNYELSNNESKTIDISKALFSVMVVFVHVYEAKIFALGNEISLTNPTWLEVIKITISKSVSGSAVPAFFLISSLLLYRKQFTWTANMKKKIKSLLIPYILLNAFWVLFDAIPFSQEGIQNLFHDGMLINWGIKEWEEAFFGLFSGYPYLFTLWYVRDLLILNIFSVAIKRMIDKVPEVALAVLIVLYFLVDTKFIIASDSEGVYNYLFTAIFWWSVGYYLIKYRLHLQDLVNKWNFKALLFAYTILLCASTFIYYKNLDYLFTVKRICTFVGVVFWFRIAFVINSPKIKKRLLWFSSFSFSIYVFHEKAQTYFRQICALVLPQNNIFTSVYMYFIVPFIIIVCCIVFSILLKKFTPSFYSLITGNRANKNIDMQDPSEYSSCVEQRNRSN